MKEYESIPYPSLVHAHTHPDRLAVVGRLLGLHAADSDAWRVLEVGCGSGANLICMAELLPASSFLGVDLAPIHVDAGREIVASLGLKNVELRQADILHLPDAIGEFDFIVAHGMYSWVSEAVRRKLLRLIRHSLAPEGIAYVSFNSYPGWFQMQPLREMMLYRTRGISDPIDAARTAREFIGLLARSMLPEAALFREFTRSYDASFLGRGPVSELQILASLIHDELAEFNQPFYFHEVAGHAREAGLEYLAEADLRGSTPAGLPKEVVEEVASFARDFVEMEQYLDFLRNRGFRRMLLCRREAPVSRGLNPGQGTLAGLHVASPMRPARSTGRSDGSGSVMRFAAANGQTFSTDHAVTQAALRRLGGLYPRSVGFEELLETSLDDVPSGNKSSEGDLLARNLLGATLIGRSLVELYVSPRPLVTKVSKFPRSQGFTRLLAAEGAEEAPNLRHEQVRLGLAARALLPLLDGEHDIEAMQSALADGFSERGLPPLTVREIRTALNGLARAGMLLN